VVEDRYGVGDDERYELVLVTAGLRYDLSDSADLKLEYSVITTDEGRGLFENSPSDKNVGRFGVAVDVVF